jgi:cobalamin biosynthesis protein CobD/CbiB
LKGGISVDQEEKYSRLYHRLLEEMSDFHRANQVRIRKGMLSLLLVPLVFLVLLFLTESSKVIFLLLWIASMFIISAYLIALEYLDEQMRHKLQDIAQLEEQELDSLLESDRQKRRQELRQRLQNLAREVRSLNRNGDTAETDETEELLTEVEQTESELGEEETP